MKSSLVAVVFIEIILFSRLSLATDPVTDSKEVGNGGNVVYCLGADGKTPTSIELLDYYELSEEWGLSFDLGDKSLAPLDKVKIALERARRFHPQSADELETRAQGFFDDANLIAGADLTPVDDADQHFLPEGCSLKQLAVQRQKEFPQDKTFLINKDVWDQMTSDQQAGLILHEIIYEKLLKDTPPQGESPESRMARYFNALISSKDFESYSITTYLPMLSDLWFIHDLILNGTLLENVQFSSYAVGGIAMAGGNKTFSAMPTTPMNLQFLGVTYTAPVGQNVSFYTNGQMESIYLNDRQVIQIPWQGKTINISDGIDLYYTGVAKDFHLANPIQYQLPNGTNVTIEDEVEF